MASNRSADPNNKEPTPAQVVQDFTQSQQYTFQQQIQQQEGAPANIDVGLSGKTQSSAVQGEIPPEPVATPTSTPITQKTSPASVVQVVWCLILALLLANY